MLNNIMLVLVITVIFIIIFLTQLSFRNSHVYFYCYEMVFSAMLTLLFLSAIYSSNPIFIFIGFLQFLFISMELVIVTFYLLKTTHH